MDPEAFHDRTSRSFADGGFRLVIVLDSAPDELIQVVGYLRIVTDKIDVDAEEKASDPMAGLRPPHVPGKPVPMFTGKELLRLKLACTARPFQQRRDSAVIAMFRATGMRLSELASVRYDPGDPRRTDIDLWHRDLGSA